jgi:uncharacterized protein YciI
MPTPPEGIAIPAVPYFLVLLVPDRNHPASPEHFAEHVDFIGEMAAHHVVLLGGDFGATIEGAEAAYVLHTTSQIEAEEWAARDPLVRNAIYKPRIVAWNLVGISVSSIDPALRW